MKTAPNPKTWQPWSWYPQMPRAALIAATLLADFLFCLVWTIHLPTQEETLREQLKFFFPYPPIAAYLGTLTLIQLNMEVIHMFLSQWILKKEREAAVALAASNSHTAGREAGRAEGQAEGRAEGRAQLAAETQEWFEKYQQDPSAAPPPPFLNGSPANGKAPEQGYSL